MINNANKKPNRIFLPVKLIFANANPAKAFTIIDPSANVPA